MKWKKIGRKNFDLYVTRTTKYFHPSVKCHSFTDRKSPHSPNYYFRHWPGKEGRTKRVAESEGRKDEMTTSDSLSCPSKVESVNERGKGEGSLSQFTPILMKFALFVLLDITSQTLYYNHHVSLSQSTEFLSHSVEYPSETRASRGARCPVLA